MQLNVYAVYDRAALAFMQPMFLQADGVAQRAFMEALSDPQTQFCKHPMDYKMMRIATWDDASGLFVESVQLIVDGLDVVRSVPRPPPVDHAEELAAT